MNKQDNKLTISVLAALTAAIALIYTLIMYHDMIYAVVGISLIFLITAFILTRNFITFSTMKNKSLNVQLKHYIDDISTQLEAMNGAQSQIGKATYVYTKQAAQVVTTLENNYIESQEALYKNLASLSDAQIKTTKLILKNDQNNTAKITTNIKDMNNQLKDTLTQGFDQIHPDHPELITALQEIVHYLKNQSAGIEPNLEMQLNNIAQELQNIFDSIQQISVPEVMQAASITPQLAETNITPTEENSLMTDIIPSHETSPITDTSPMEDVASVTDITLEEDTVSVTDINPIEDTVPITDVAPAEETALITDITLADETTQTADTMPEPITDISSGKETNDKLSADEIAALFAASDPAPKKKSSSKVSTAETILETTETEPTANDSNKQLSADEIAALFSSLG